MYHAVGTAPAVVLAPQGISLAAALIFGYAAIPASALAAFFVALYGGNPLPLALLTFLANFAQPAITLFVLDKLKASRLFENAWDFYKYIGVAFFTSGIVPAAYVFGREAYNQIATAPVELLDGKTLWVAGLVSALILAPFLVRLIRPLEKFAHGKWFQNILAIVMLNIPTAILTYTPTTSFLGVSLLLPFCLILMWIALRGGTFFVTFAMVTVSVSAISGRILGHPPNPGDLSLADQIVSAQTSLIVFALLFYFIAALDEGRRIANQKLRKYTERLESVVSQQQLDAHAKNEFIATLAHELRNPLAPVMSFIEVLKLQVADEAAQESIAGIEENARMMRHLLDDLLDAARVSQGKFMLKKEPVNLGDVLRSSLSSIEDFAKAKDITVNATFPEREIVIEADPVRLRQIVMNLLNNACKYTEAGGHLSLSAELVKNSIVIRVSDTGVGIAPGSIQRLFQPFTQLHNSPERGTGLGIGLYLTKRLTEMHGGKLSVKSEGKGKGSTFSVTLPLPEQAQIRFRKRAKSPAFSGKKKILIVDDNEAAANSLKKLLTLHGHEAETAYSGAEALALVDEVLPEIILLDIGMPGMTGHEVAERLRERGWGGIIVAISGYGQESDRVRSREAGFDHHLVKPVSIDEVLAVLAAPGTVAVVA
jgi:signal transduction histidine kinase/ActR/RegA family two-component response regulator